MCNQGAIAPAPGYLEGALAACRKHGAILIFDEVITGFRLGREGAQGRFGVTPDLSIFAKAIANGFPVAAIVGRADLMDMFATGGVLHGGTFNAQPVTMAAMVATQKALTPEHYEKTSVYGVRLRDGIRDILAEAGIKAQVTGFELMFHVGFGLDAPARNYRDLPAPTRPAMSASPMPCCSAACACWSAAPGSSPPSMTRRWSTRRSKPSGPPRAKSPRRWRPDPANRDGPDQGHLTRPPRTAPGTSGLCPESYPWDLLPPHECRKTRAGRECSSMVRAIRS